MDKALKAKWLEALRSGKYKQGQQRLRNCKDEFCCLGVLCDISRQGAWKMVKDEDGYCYSKGWEDDCCVLPPFMDEFSGIWRGEQERLMDLNDTERRSFPEIANWIEKNVPED